MMNNKLIYLFIISLLVGGINTFIMIVIPMTPEQEKGMITRWISAIELRNGDRYYISNKTQQAAINFNFYVFGGFNLFYYRYKDKSTTFIGNIPTHAPKAIAIIPNTNIHDDGVDEGNVLLVMTSGCLLTFDMFNDPYAYHPSIEAGNCYESGNRDGLREFARFNELSAMGVSRKSVWVVSDKLLSGNTGFNTRLCLVHNQIVITFGKSSDLLFPPITAISVSLVEKDVSRETGELFIAICWESGLSIIWIPEYSPSLQEISIQQFRNLVPAVISKQSTYLFSQIVVNSITLFEKEKEGKRQLYLFKMDSDGYVVKDLIQWEENNTQFYNIQQQLLLDVVNGTGLISLYVDFPYGVFVADGHKQQFYKVNTLGCACPPGYALLPNSTHCQLAPAGGYVDILGNFIPCPPGTFGNLKQATSRQSCVPCPPFKISNTSQSLSCTTCISNASLLPHNPLKNECIQTCPRGSYLGVKGSCTACPTGSSSSVFGNCEQCPSDTFSHPAIGIIECMACPAGKTADPGSSTCSTVCSSGCAPRGSGECQESPRKDLLISISILGTKAVGGALAKNGTIYIAGFQLLIVIDKSGSSLNIPLAEFTLVRDLSLSLDERILYAAITSQEILCFTFVGTSRLSWTNEVVIPGTAIISIRPTINDAIIVHDAVSNKIFSIGRKTGWVSVLYAGETDDGIIVSMLDVSQESSLYVLLQDRNTNQTSNTTKQKIIIVDKRTLKNRKVVLAGLILNSHMAFWQGRVILSIQNAIGWLDVNSTSDSGNVKYLVGLTNISGRVDNVGEAARLSTPGPMMPTPQALLVVDHTALRMIYPLGSVCQCDEDYYYHESKKACQPCPTGMFALPGTMGSCSNCARGQYTDANGKCVPCPKAIWWLGETLSCPLVIDTMVGRDTSGLSMQDIFLEMSEENPQHYDALNIMKNNDYVSTHTLQLPIHEDSVMQDDAAKGRFWIRSKRITPPPEIFISTNPNVPLHATLQVVLPGFWIVCSSYVLQTETCSCDLPPGGIKLGSNDDITQLWNKERYKAASIDYNTLLITLPPDPDLYDGGGIEYIHFMNISVSPTALFVSRTDAGGGTDDDNPSVIFIDSVIGDTEVPIPPPPEPTPSESSFAVCVAGWPATYTCPTGFLWVAPLYTCIPCKPGYYHDYDGSGHCLPCPKGSFSSLEGSTSCTECSAARTIASTFCLSNAPSNSTQVSIICNAGYENRDMLSCMPCIPGFFKANSDTLTCSPCPAGSYSALSASTLCKQCISPLVSTQWGSTECIACASGYVPLGNRCKLCTPVTQYFSTDINKNPVCKNKTVLYCEHGFYLKDGGGISDNQCVACMGCKSGEIMTPYDPFPCNYQSTTMLGAPYRCVPVDSIQGLFARLALNPSDIHNFSIQYTPCEGLPRFASWAQGPDPMLCYFQCNYVISEAGAMQYAYYYEAEQGGFIMNTIMGTVLKLHPKNNLFLLDYPGLSVHLMLLSKEICLPCPKTQCGWGKYRPITDAVNGCGPPTCVLYPSSCQVVSGGSMETYTNDGCIENCSYPEFAYISSLSPPGTGDNCGWKCNLGFYRKLIMLDSDENETGYTCAPCNTNICEKGQLYVPTKCLPHTTNDDFCISCPTDPQGLALLSISDSKRGACQYNCIQGSYLSPLNNNGMVPSCIACTNTTYCPTGFRQVCSVENCVACPNLPSSLWGSAVKMPSNKATCQAACRSGYHTIDLGTGQVILPKSLATSYDANTIGCSLCSLRPSISCSSSNLCSTGYYMPVMGSGLCKPCPTVYDCGAGFSPSSCVCTICRIKSSDTVFIQQGLADGLAGLSAAIIGKEIVMDFGTCPAVCKHNSIFMGDSSKGICSPCSNIPIQSGSIFTAYYSVWNASNSFRWWDPSQDPSHLPPRPSSPIERRAGLCWPCPPGKSTVEGDSDLCESSLSIQTKQEASVIFDSADIVLSAAPDTNSGNIVSSILSNMLTLFNTRAKRIASTTAPVIMDNNTISGTAPTVRRRSLLQFTSPIISNRKQKLHRPHQVVGFRKKRKRNKIRQWLEGIRVQPQYLMDTSSHYFTSSTIIKTCPAFALWDNPYTKNMCVCMSGFKKHMHDDMCVPQSSISNHRRQNYPIRTKIMVSTTHKKKQEEHCASHLACSEGKYMDQHGICRLCPLMFIYNDTTRSCECPFRAGCDPCPQKNEYTMILSNHDTECRKCPGNMVPLHSFYFPNTKDLCACPSGTQKVSEECIPCSLGTYSSFVGNSPCTTCPSGLSTHSIGAENIFQCVKIDVVEDSIFVHHEDSEFYRKEKSLLQWRWKKSLE